MSPSSAARRPSDPQKCRPVCKNTPPGDRAPLSACRFMSSSAAQPQTDAVTPYRDRDAPRPMGDGRDDTRTNKHDPAHRRRTLNAMWTTERASDVKYVMRDGSCMHVGELCDDEVPWGKPRSHPAPYLSECSTERRDALCHRRPPVLPDVCQRYWDIWRRAKARPKVELRHSFRRMSGFTLIYSRCNRPFLSGFHSNFHN